MKASELRIGNLVLLNGKIIEIMGLFDTMIWYRSDHNTFSANLDNEIKPIPLTEEIKGKFGKNEDVLVDKNGFVIFKNGYAYQFVFEDYLFIHSIQNLYREITGKELELNKSKQDEI